MLHKARELHRIVGLVNAVFLLLISVTGFLLTTKSRVAWIRPEEKTGQKIESHVDTISVDRAMQSAFAVGLAELKTPKDIDRVDYRPKRNVYKIVAKTGYQEVQVDGKTGEVLQVAKRVDQFTEDLHDLSFFGDAFNTFVLPVVALCLATLSVSGIVIYTMPILRRRKFFKKNPPKAG